MKTSSPEQTRDKIVQTAFEEFYQNGFQGASLNRIVEKAGITKGALFHHFKGKDQLGYTVVEEVIHPEVTERWVGPLNKSIDPITDIMGIMQAEAAEGVEHICQGCPLNNLAQEMSPLDDEFRRRLNVCYDEWRSAISNAFERGIKAGTVRADVGPEKIAIFIVAALTGMVGLAKNAQCPELLMSSAEAFFDYLKSLRP